MRLFTFSQWKDMGWWLWFSLLLSSLSAAESTESCLSQPERTISKKTGQTAVLNCTVQPQCSGEDWRFEWFSFSKHSHRRIKDQPHKYSLEGASLKIFSLTVNDSGIYHCAAFLPGEPQQGSQYVGSGTTLQVKEKEKIMIRQILLWVSLILLTIYSSAIMALIVKKYGCSVGAVKGKSKSDNSHSSKKIQFRDVLQEMYNKRITDRSKGTVSRNRSPAEASDNDANGSTDDIYQNV